MSREKIIRTAVLLLMMVTAFVQAQTDILIVGRSWAGELNNWKTVLEGLGSVTVTITETTPADLTKYEQVWYADFKNWTSDGMAGGTYAEPSASAITTVLPQYLKTGGKIAFLTDHCAGGSYAAPLAVHTKIAEFIKLTTVNGSKFGIEKTVAYDGNNITVNIDSKFGVDAALEAKLEDPSKNYQVNSCAYILPTKIGSGLGVLKFQVQTSWYPTNVFEDRFVGVAFVGDSFLPEYKQGGRVFVFTDIFNALKAGQSGNTQDNNDLLELIATISGGKDLATTTIDLDTNGTAVAAGSKVFYNPTLKANIKTHAIADISYTVNGTAKGIIGKGTASIDLDGTLPDSAEIEVTVKGESGTVTVQEQKAKWTFIKKKEAVVKLDTVSSLANPIPAGTKVIYGTPSITAYVSGDGDNITYTLNGTAGTPITGKSGSIVIPSTMKDTVEVKVTAAGTRVNPKTETWTFIRDLPASVLYLNGQIQNADLTSAAANAIAFESATLPVTIELKDGSGKAVTNANIKITYARKNGDPKTAGTAYSPFTINSGDTIRAIATADGFDAPAEAYWILKQDLPDSRLLAFQGTAESKKADEVNVFTTPTEKITLKLIGPKDEPIILGTATKIWYTTGDAKPEIGKSKEYSDALGVVLTKSDTVRAIAEVYGYDAPIEGRWFYIQDLPEAQIVATPSETFPTAYSFSSSKMSVTLKVIGSDGAEIPLGPKCSIKYAQKNGDPKSGTAYTGSPITITGNDTIRAFADLTDFDDPKEGIWAYKQELKTADLIAEPGSAVSTKPYEYPTGSMSVKLKTSSGDTIYYHIASTGPKVIAVKDSATVVITGNDTIWAYADGTESNRRDTVWTYESKLPAANLTADPSKSPVMYFGHTLKVVLNSTNADTIRYTRDGSVPTETSNLFVPGKDTIRILDTDRDTVVISGYAYGKDLAPTKASWTYVRDTLPVLKADPAGKKFTGTVDVKLAFSKAVDPDWKNVKIYYTLDGSIPDTTDLLYSGSVKIDTTTTLKARAYADNRIESPVLTEQYTEAAEAVTAWYLDESGDGAIDAAQIVLSKSVTLLPDSLTLLSPFDSTEKRVVLKADLTLADRNVIRAELKKPFTFTGSTIFKPAVLGTMNGEEYLPNSPVTIADSIAPVLIRAEYSFGLITSQEPVIVRAKDTLEVTFSEPVTIGSLKEPFALKHLGAPYSLILADGAKVTETALFVVDSVKDAESPVPGDSIHIDPKAGVTGSGRVQNNADNRWIAVIVNRPPHALTILAITPSNPTKDTIAKGLEPKIYRGSTASIIVADFMMKLWETDGMNAKVVILDPLGNVVAKSGALGSGEGLVSELRTDPRTQIVIYWDGRNEAGRRVGSGLYLARVEITDPYGAAVREMVQIAVTKDSE